MVGARTSRLQARALQGGTKVEEEMEEEVGDNMEAVEAKALTNMDQEEGLQV